MSWFPDDLAAFERLDPGLRVHDEATDVAVAPGVTVARRTVLWLSAAGVTALLAARPRAQDPAPAPAGPAGGLRFADFLREVLPLAQAQLRDGARGEDTYLLAVAGAMTRLAEPGTGVREDLQAFRREHAQGGARFPIAAMVMKLEPGGGFRHHDHRDYNGIILGLAGEVRIRNFDILGDVPVPPKGATFQIRETRDDLILPGRFSMLARGAENVHELVAGPEGARVLDLFTFYRPGAQSHWLDVEARPRDAARRVYDAAWA